LSVGKAEWTGGAADARCVVTALKAGLAEAWPFSQTHPCAGGTALSARRPARAAD
jgi:hypothetical protein